MLIGVMTLHFMLTCTVSHAQMLARMKQDVTPMPTQREIPFREAALVSGSTVVRRQDSAANDATPRSAAAATATKGLVGSFIFRHVLHKAGATLTIFWCSPSCLVPTDW